MIRIPLFLLAATLAVLPASAQADTSFTEEAAPLFTGTLAINRSANLFSGNQFDLDIGFSDAPFSPTNLVRLFDDLIISPANVGDVFEATVETDPIFLTAVDRLTDASNEFIQTFLTEDISGGLTEYQSPPENNFFLFGSPSAAPNPLEVIITSISLRIDKFVLLPNSGSGPAPLDLSMTFTLNGVPIPEPSAAWLFVCGFAILGLLLLRRRRPQLAKALLP